MHRVIIFYMHNRKYRLRYGQSVTCLFHSVKFFALAVQSTQLVTLRAIYRKQRNSNKQSHHKANKRSTNKHKGFSNKTKRLDTVQVSMCSKVIGGSELERVNI